MKLKIFCEQQQINQFQNALIPSNETISYLPTAQGFPGQSRDFVLCPGVQGFTPFVQEF